MSITIFITLLILLLAGLFGVLFPVLPGIPFMFVVVLVYAAIEGFDRIGATSLIIFGLITLLSLGVDYLSGFLGAKFFGASKKGALGGIVGSIIGLFIFPPFGLFLGLFLGVFLAEKYLNKNEIQKSTKAASGAIAGSIVGILANFVLGLAFIAYFVISYF